MTRLEQAQQLISEMTMDEKILVLRSLMVKMGADQAILDTIDDVTLILRAREAAKGGFASPEESMEFIQRVLGRDAESI